MNLLHDFHKPRICEIQLGWRQQFQLGHCNENKREYKLQKKKKKKIIKIEWEIENEKEM